MCSQMSQIMFFYGRFECSVFCCKAGWHFMHPCKQYCWQYRQDCWQQNKDCWQIQATDWGVSFIKELFFLNKRTNIKFYDRHKELYKNLSMFLPRIPMKWSFHDISWHLGHFARGRNCSRIFVVFPPPFFKFYLLPR